MKDKTIITLFGIGSITLLQALNLIYYGIDGALLAGVVGVVAGIVGYEAKDWLKK